MARIPFDSERDCSRPDTAQDLRIADLGDCLCIEQPDGAGEDYHIVKLPKHLIGAFAEALHTVVSGTHSVTLDGRPETDD